MLTRHPLLTVWLLGILLVLLALAIAMEPSGAQTTAPAGPERIVFMSTRGGGGYAIWSMAPDGTDAVQLTHPGPLEQDYEPHISPDGRKIAFGRYVPSGGNYEIFVMDADGSDVHNITNNPASDQNPSWSPDGTQIAFQSDRDNFFREVYVMKADGSNVVQLTDDPAYDGRPAWSPDGDKIAFESQRDHGYTKIFTVPADGGAATKVTPWDWDVMQPAWSPDGTTIAVSAEGPLFIDVDSIWLIPLAGGDPARLSTEQGSFPRYSPDGSQITFSSDRDGHRQVYVMSSGGGSETNLSNSDAWEDMPDWGYLAAGEIGDISGDGAVDQGDVLPFLSYLAGTSAPPSGLPNGDLDCSGDYDIPDVLRLLWYLAEVTDRPDVCVAGG